MSAEKKTLPTTPGWYVQADEPLTEVSTVWRLDNDGEWWFEQWDLPEEQVLHNAPLARLVIETDTAQHPEVDMVKAREAFEAANNPSFSDDFVATLHRVLAGEFDL